MTKNEIYNTYVEEMETSGVKPISLPMFSRMWQKKFRNVIIPKVYVHLNLLVKYCVDFKSYPLIWSTLFSFCLFTVLLLLFQENKFTKCGVCVALKLCLQGTTDTGTAQGEGLGGL